MRGDAASGCSPPYERASRAGPLFGSVREVLGADLVEELAELLDLLLLFVVLEEDARLGEDLLVGEDRDRLGVAYRQRDRVGWPGGDAEHAAGAVDFDLGEE